MAPKLTRKQKTFVKEYLETGVGSEAVRRAYDIEPQQTRLASVMAAENLANPSIREEVTRGLQKREERVERAHDSLLTAVRLDYFVFAKAMSDEEIKAHVEAQGLTCLNIRPSDRGKLAFFSLPDGASRGKGIELFHKVQGTFAPDKHISVHVKAEPSDRIKELAKKLNNA